MAFIKFKFEKDKEERPIKTLKLGKKKKKTGEIKPKPKKPVKQGSKSFILEWESELGYAENPFKTRILAPINNYFAGYEKERNKINLFIINNEKFGIITGQDGIGKTTLLRWLYEQLQQYKDKVLVYYFDSRVFSQEFILVKSLVNPLLSMYEKKVKKLNKDTNIERNLSLLKDKIGSRKLILLVDDVTAMPTRVMFLIRKIYDIMPFQLIITANNQYAQKLRETEWLNDRLKMQLKGMSPEEAIIMIRKRIKAVGGEDIFPFDENHIKTICKIAENNPKKILDLCQHKAIELAVQHIKRKAPKQVKVVKEEIESQKEELKEENQEEEGFVPVLKEIPKRKEYQIRVINQGSEAISLDDLHKDDKGNYKIKAEKKK